MNTQRTAKITYNLILNTLSYADDRHIEESKKNSRRLYQKINNLNNCLKASKNNILLNFKHFKLKKMINTYREEENSKVTVPKTKK